MGLLNQVEAMAKGTLPLIGKASWSKLVWEQAWNIDDGHWSSLKAINADNDLLFKVLGQSSYITWWAISDKHTDYMRMCEIMSKIVCRASL